MHRVFLVGGSPQAKQPSHLAPGPDDWVIAADRGAHHARSWGWPVHLLVGDLDSLGSAAASAESAAGTPVIRVPAAKDLTDMELALEHALPRNPDAIVICGGLGGRIDHLLANVLLLARPDLARRNVVLADGAETLRLLQSDSTEGGCATLEVLGQQGDLLTLLPFGGDAEGISTAQLIYPLHGEVLRCGEARGVSNVFAADRATISLRQGRVLVVHISKE